MGKIHKIPCDTNIKNSIDEIRKSGWYLWLTRNSQKNENWEIGDELHFYKKHKCIMTAKLRLKPKFLNSKDENVKYKLIHHFDFNPKNDDYIEIYKHTTELWFNEITMLVNF